MVEVRCKVCDAGTLVRRKKFRMSGLVVAIGYILPIPSILGILFSAFMFFSAASLPHTANDVASANMATGVVGGVAIFFGIASFVGGLIGWLLVMKKQVLECGTSKAVVNAS
jgi:hypothetical protein